MVKVPKASRGVPPSHSRASTVWKRNSEVTFVWTEASSVPSALMKILGDRTPKGPSDSASELDGPRWQALSPLWHKPFGTVWLVNASLPKEEDLRGIAAKFLERCYFPNCLGSIAGKHVVIQAPPCSGSQFYNCKGTYSVVLLAVVDAICGFRVVNVGAYGKGSDGGTLWDSAFGQAFQDGTLEFPPPASLPGAEDLGPVPHVFVGNEAFPLRPNLMRPYAGCQLPLPKPVRIFNKQLSRARLVVECAFVILAARWRMYRRVLGLSLSNVDACVKATCVLHNYLRRSFPGGALDEDVHAKWLPT
ncbi:structure-specific endonuclease subunit SLX1 isoform X1 [Oncorhynchus tshawytscha]|uniref:DDE Tnp4 domain-containing protein n=1 Tax=Oncorhynchus tshawytscha TaxID=74940 RepID=A0AAZ3PK18_ONCTS|nr:structure-specific endonuclease subunit SLX1 isoform X1 [Oncorhynchus tshawytscha]